MSHRPPPEQVVPNPNLDSLSRSYAAANATHHGKVGGTISVNGSFDTMHWHAPSDHTINGQRLSSTSSTRKAFDSIHKERKG